MSDTRPDESRSEILWYLMVEVALFTFAALAHGGVIVTGYEFPKAAMAETVIAVILGAALIMSFVSPTTTRTVALITQGVALLAVVAGVVTIVMGISPQTLQNIVVHAVMLITLGLGFAVAQRGVHT
jgi:hypothetical protein